MLHRYVRSNGDASSHLLGFRDQLAFWTHKALVCILKINTGDAQVTVKQHIHTPYEVSADRIMLR